ncbi:MAG: CDP-alcohol phosphatidyltransferase family protein [Chloroflexi bacterium]|nr:CDP-alcohol phosphatidyltransferase family protein [Chloroflexota bacterium]
MISDWGRKHSKFILEPIADIFLKLHFTPNRITLLGLIITFFVGYLVVTDHLLAAGLLYVIGAGADAVDGTVARRIGIKNAFGAFWDSTLDRLGETLVIAALGYRAALSGDTLTVLLAFSSLVTSYLVSYTRARAEGLDLECKVGIGTRVERFLIMLLALLFQQPTIGLAVITLVAGITVLQRIYAVWQQTRQT